MVHTVAGPPLAPIAVAGQAAAAVSALMPRELVSEVSIGAVALLWKKAEDFATVSMVNMSEANPLELVVSEVVNRPLLKPEVNFEFAP